MSNSKFDLSGKVALVTGANGGIGLGMATALAEAGADVCIWGRNADKNSAAADSLRSYGNKVLALQCDVSDQQQVQENYTKTLESMGRVDACFANAGIGSFGTPFHEMSVDEWRMIFGINMEGVFFTFQTAVRHMMKQGNGGSLVVTSSLSAKAGLPHAQHYAATKAGVLAIMRGLAVEYARYGIRANAILPDGVCRQISALLRCISPAMRANIIRVMQWSLMVVFQNFDANPVFFSNSSTFVIVCLINYICRSMNWSQ
jgi:NAD(P)-dependent dehydrogenase (short-subunit alcohol dehydrogenase family)